MIKISQVQYNPGYMKSKQFINSDNQHYSCIPVTYIFPPNGKTKVLWALDYLDYIVNEQWNTSLPTYIYHENFITF